jgi:hypothetical protein
MRTVLQSGEHYSDRLRNNIGRRMLSWHPEGPPQSIMDGHSSYLSGLLVRGPLHGLEPHHWL